MTDELAKSMYEDGRTLAEIAEAVGKTPSEVDALLNAIDSDADEETLSPQDRKQLRDLRRMRSIGDGIAMNYLQDVKDLLVDPKRTLEERRAVYAEEMDTVYKYNKMISDRTLLAEGKMTEHIGVNGSGGLPFNVTFTKTYEKEQSSDPSP